MIGLRFLFCRGRAHTIVIATFIFIFDCCCCVYSQTWSFFKLVCAIGTAFFCHAACRRPAACLLLRRTRSVFRKTDHFVRDMKECDSDTLTRSGCPLQSY